MPALVKETIKKIALIMVIALCIPLFGIVSKVIYAYGTYVGTYARIIIEEGICK